MAKSPKPPELEFSPLSGEFSRDNVSIIIEIFRPEGSTNGWSLEVITGDDAGIAWEDAFETDQEAYDELMLLIEERGIQNLITPPADQSEANDAQVAP